MDRIGRKDFDGWMVIKKKLHYGGSLRRIKDGDIWWCAIGENVGSEICGKGKIFARPVVVARKLDRYNFIGVPLTSKNHAGSWYTDFVFQDKKQIAVLSQVENISVQRLYNKMGVLSDPDLGIIRERLCDLIAGIKNTP